MEFVGVFARCSRTKEGSRGISSGRSGEGLRLLRARERNQEGLQDETIGLRESFSERRKRKVEQGRRAAAVTCVVKKSRERSTSSFSSSSSSSFVVILSALLMMMMML